MHALARHGIDALALPLIDIAPALDTTAVITAWRELEAARLVMFVSANAVAHFFALRPDDMAWPSAVQAASPGPGTTRALREAGLALSQIVEPAADSAQFDSESLWQCLREQDWRGAPVRVVRGDGGRDWLADTLRAHGADVRFVSAYRRSAPRWNAEMQSALDRALAQPDHHLWFFSSSESIDHLMSHLTTQTQLDPSSGRQASLPPGARALATHPRIAERAEQAGFSPVWRSKPALADVVACIQSIAP